MSLLAPTPLSTERLVKGGAALLVAEISDLGPGFSFGRVWDDACDEGVTLVNHLTGKRVVYAVDHVERDADGDLLWWDLIPATRCERGAMPTIRLFND